MIKKFFKKSQIPRNLAGGCVLCGRHCVQPTGEPGRRNEGFPLLPFNFFSENERFLSLLLSVKKTNSRQHSSSLFYYSVVAYLSSQQFASLSIGKKKKKKRNDAGFLKVKQLVAPFATKVKNNSKVAQLENSSGLCK